MSYSAAGLWASSARCATAYGYPVRDPGRVAAVFADGPSGVMPGEPGRLERPVVENARLASTGTGVAAHAGKMTSMARPPSGRAVVVSMASWAVAMARTIESPRPRPSGL